MVNWPRSGAMGGAGFQAGIQVQIRVGVLLQQTDENLGHDAPADGPQSRGPCRRSRPPSGCRTTAGPRRPIPDPRRASLRSWFSTSYSWRTFTTLPTIGISTSMRWFVHNWVGVRGVTPISRATCCPEGRPIFLPRRRFRCDSRPRVLVSGSAVVGILNSGSASEASNWRTGRAVGLLPRYVEELAPLNLQPRQQLAVPVQVVVGGRVLEQRHARDRAQERASAVEDVPDGVAGPGDAVAEAVRGHSELDRDEGAPRGVRRLVVLEGDLRGPGRALPCTPSRTWSAPRWRGGTRGSRSTGSATGPAAEPTRTRPTAALRLLRRMSTSLLWNFCIATWSWRMISVWSLRGSAMIAVPSGRPSGSLAGTRGTS